MPKHSAPRIIWRYLTGRPLDGTARPGAARRVAYRLGIPAALCATGAAYHRWPDATRGMVAVLAAYAAVRVGRAVRRAWRHRRFRGAYIRPVLAALTGALGEAPVRLHVDPALGTLLPRLARPMSPAETATRAWYGAHVEPVVRWLPDQLQRALWALQRMARPVTRHTHLFRRPGAQDTGPRIELRASVPYLTPEQRQYVSAVISAKVPAGELVEQWDQVGPRVIATWTVRRRPPNRVGYADLDARAKQLAEDAYFLGLGVGGRPVTVSLSDDSPHICISASSGAGKSVLAQAIALQVLVRGGQVVILDIKGSHRWALGLPGVTYCMTVEQIHDAWVRLGALAGDRNARALSEPEGWDPGPRHLVIAEELNATMDLLLDYWAEIREKSDSKKSPAIRAAKQILTMGRSAKVNLVGVAQMLTAQSIGGPAARENFAIRCLARYSANAWKMLCPEAAMPRASRTQGRWQIVVGGVATECQVAFLTPGEARLFVNKHRVPVSPDSLLMASDQEMSPGHGSGGDSVDPLSELLTLRAAVERGLVPGQFAAAKKRLQRGRAAGKPTVPVSAGREGQADLYRVGDLIIWVESELIS